MQSKMIPQQMAVRAITNSKSRLSWSLSNSARPVCHHFERFMFLFLFLTTAALPIMKASAQMPPSWTTTPCTGPFNTDGVFYHKSGCTRTSTMVVSGGAGLWIDGGSYNGVLFSYTTSWKSSFVLTVNGASFLQQDFSYAFYLPGSSSMNLTFVGT